MPFTKFKNLILLSLSLYLQVSLCLSLPTYVSVYVYLPVVLILGVFLYLWCVLLYDVSFYRMYLSRICVFLYLLVLLYFFFSLSLHISLSYIIYNSVYLKILFFLNLNAHVCVNQMSFLNALVVAPVVVIPLNFFLIQPLHLSLYLSLPINWQGFNLLLMLVNKNAPKVAIKENIIDNNICCYLCSGIFFTVLLKFFYVKINFASW